MRPVSGKCAVYMAVLSVVLGFVRLPAAVAEPLPDNPAMREALLARLQALDSFSSDFLQLVRDGEGVVVENASGNFLLSKPDRFRWHYDTPWPRDIVADGTDLWQYDEELEQVTVRPFAGVIEQTPAGILAGNLEQLDGYAIAGEQLSDGLLVNLQPRQSRPDFSAIELRFVDGVLTAMQLVDQFGQTTRILFENAVLNPPTGEDAFQFVLPAGADLIDER